MSIWSDIAQRVRGLLGREPDANLGDEVRFHLEMETRQLEASGLSRDAALAEAHRRFGGVDRYTEELRDERGARTLEHLRLDARYALRLARRFPAFTAIVVLTLGISIGANTAIFSVVNAVLLRPLPFPNGDDLVFLYAQNPDKSLPRFSVSYADFLDWRKQTHSFTDIAAFTTSSLTFTQNDEAERVSGLSVTSNYFDVLQVRPKLGRLFHDGDLAADTDNEIVLTYGFWQRALAGDPAVVGRPIKNGGSARTVIGVLPAEFDLNGGGVEALTVLDAGRLPDVQSHAQHILSAIGRLRPGTSLESAQADLLGVATRLAAANPEISGWTANVFRLRDEIVRNLASPLYILLAAAGLVLLIGCINVANLLITRAASRGREVALRQAIGASRGRLVSQFLVESSIAAIAGGVLGALLLLASPLSRMRTLPAEAVWDAPGVTD